MKTTWIKSFLATGIKWLPCTVFLTAALATTVVQAAEVSYSWNKKKGFVDATGTPVVIDKDFTITAKFTMPSTVNSGDVIVFNATKGDGTSVGGLGVKGWSGTQVSYLVGATTTTSGGHYSEDHFSNTDTKANGSGVNTLTITATGFNAGAVASSNFKMDFAGAGTAGSVENNGASGEAGPTNGSFGTDPFSFTGVTLADGASLISATLTMDLPDPVWEWDGTKTDGTLCDTVITLPTKLGETVYSVSGQIFDLSSQNIPSKTFSFAFWTTREGPANWRDYAGFANEEGYLQVQRDDTGIFVQCYLQDGPTWGSGNNLPFALSSVSYQRVVLVHDTTVVKVYVDGKLISTNTVNSDTWASLSSDTGIMKYFGLGCAPSKTGGDNGRAGTAWIADARIYNVALSAGEVAAFYNAYDFYTETLGLKRSTSTALIEGGKYSIKVSAAEAAAGTLQIAVPNTAAVTDITWDVRYFDEVENLTATFDAATKTYTFSFTPITEVGVENAEVIAVNFVNEYSQLTGAFNNMEMVGFAAPGKGDKIALRHWNHFQIANGTNVATTGSEGGTYTLSWSSPNVWYNGSTDSTVGKLLYGYLDNNFSLTLEGLPVTGYDVAIISGGDGGAFSPITVNGTAYIGSEGATVEGSGSWGTRSNGAALTEGTNVLYVPNVYGSTLEISQPNNATNARGALSAIQVFIHPAAGAQDFTAAPSGTSVTFSSIDWDEGTFVGGEANTATLTLEPGTTLTFDESPMLAELKLISSGEVTVALGGSVTSLDIALADINSFNYAEVGQLNIGSLTATALTAPGGTTLAMVSPSQITTLTRANGSTIKFSEAVTGEESVLLLQDNTTVETTGNVTINGSIKETLKGRGWTLSGGTSTISDSFYLAAGAAWANPGNKASLKIENGATLTVNGTASTLGRNKTDGAMMFAECGNGSTVTITGEGSALSVPNGAINLSRDGATTATVSDGASLTAYKLGGTSNSSTLTINNATLVLGKADATDGTVQMTAGKLILDGATLSANGDWSVNTGSTASQIEVANTLTVNPNGKTITLRNMTFQTGAALTATGSGVLDIRELSGMDAYTKTLSGTVNVKTAAGSEGTVTLGDDATITLYLSSQQMITGYTAAGVTGNGTIVFMDPDGNEVTEGVSGNVYLPATPRWTATTATGSWSDTTLWSTGTVPTSGDIVIDITGVTDDVTLTVDATTTLGTVTVLGGENTLTFSPTATNALTVSKIDISANTDVRNGITLTADGTVVIAEGATLTVPNNMVYSGDAISLAADGLPARVTGPGTLALDLGASTSVNLTGSNANYKLGLTVLSGTLNLPNTGGDGPGKGRIITVSGSSSKLKLSNGDAMGWNYAAGQKVALYDGGTLWITKRDTMVADVDMRAGKILLDKSANANRGLDLYHANIFTVYAAEGATATAPTESSFTFSSDTATAGQTVLIRDGDLTFDVKANARLTVDATLVAGEAGLNAGGTPGKLIKNGDGELVLTAANTYNTATDVNAGVVTLSGNGKFGSGTVTLASGAVVNLVVADGATKNLTAYGSLSAVAGSIIRKSGAGALTMDTAFAGKVEVLGGTLALGTRRDVTIAALADGAVVELTRATGEQTITIPTTLTAAPAASAFSIAGQAPESVTLENGNLVVTPRSASYYWVPAGTDTNWLTLNNWRFGSVTGSAATELPTAVSDVYVVVPKTTAVTLTLDGDVTVNTMTVLASGTGENGTLTIDGTASLTATSLTVEEATVETAKLNVPTVTLNTNAQVIATVAEGTTWNVNRLSGVGTFVKNGVGTLQLAVPSSTARTVAEGVTITVNDGVLQTYLNGNDNNPILKNVVLNFAAEADGFRSHGWLGLDGSVTVNTAADLTFAAAVGAVPSLQGSGTLVKQGAGTFTWDLRGGEHANPMTIEAGAIAFAGSGSQTAAISGAGQVKIPTGATITFTVANTYSGGTSIVEGATLTANDTNGLGTAAITGAGKLIVNGYPANATVRNSLGDTAWTGHYVNTADNTLADNGNWLGAVGNTSSIVEFTGVNTGHLAKAGSMNATLKVTGSITLNNGWSDNGGYTFNGALLGEGTLATTGDQTDVLKFLGETKDFAGTINVAGSHCVAFGEQADDGTKVGMLVVQTGKTANIAAGKIWTAVNGIEVAGTLSGTGKIGDETGANGTLKLVADACLDVTGGTLTVATLDTLPDTLTVKSADALVTITDRIDVMTVTESVPTLTGVTVTLLNAEGQSLGADYALTSTTNADGDTIIQVMLAEEAETYTINMVEDGITSLTEALAGGVFGTGVTALPEESFNLVINFGDVAAGGTVVPGTFDLDHATDVKISVLTVKGTNGGTVTQTSEKDVTVAQTTIVSGVEVALPVTLVAKTQVADVAADARLVIQVPDNAGDITVATKITGAGAVALELADGATGTGSSVVFSATTSTYAGGTAIATGTHLKMAEANVLGTGAISGWNDGYGTLNFKPVISTTATTAPTLATDWAGTVVLEDVANVKGFTIPTYAPNANATVTLKNVTGWSATGKQTLVGNLILEENGYQPTDGSSSNRANLVVTGKLKGNGWIKAPTKGNFYYGYSFADASEFTGSIHFATGYGARTSVIFGVLDSWSSAYDGNVTILEGTTATIAENAVWTPAANHAIVVNGTVGGAGTIATKLTVGEGATLLASADSCLKLAADTTLSLPTQFTVQLPENTTLQPGVPFVILDRADTTTLSVTGSTVTVMSGTTPVEDAILSVTTDGDVAVQIPAAFEAEVSAVNVAWEDLAWTKGGVATTDKPSALDRATLKVQVADACITSDTLLTIGQLAVEGEAVALRFTRDCITQAMYEAIPTTVTLVETATGLDEKITVQVATLKYGALATVTQTETVATAALTLPEGAAQGSGATIYSISLALNGYQIADTDVTGLDGYEVLGTNWTRITGGQSSASGTADLIAVPLSDATSNTAQQTVTAGAISYTVGKNFYRAPNAPIPLLKGYADDGGTTSLSINLPAEEAAKGYTVIVYASNDSASDNYNFANFTVNDVHYTAVNGKTQEGTAGWGNPGPYDSSESALAEGVNTLIVKNQTAATVTISENNSGSSRGGLAGVQIVFESVDYELIPGVTATVTAATADTVVAWSDLTWVDDDGNPATAPVANTPATVVFESDATLDLTGATALQIQVLGYNHRVRFTPESVPETVPFVFSEDTIYRLATAADTLPENVERMPGTLRYEYTYDATTTAYATISKTVSDFTEGFSGNFSANGGTIRFSGGEVVLPNVNGSATATTVVFGGTSRTTVADIMRLGEGEFIVRDTASVTTSRLSLSDGAPGYTTALTLEDSAQIRVTGTTNVDQNTASIMVGHWNGASSLTLRDNARLIAEATDVLVGKTGNTQTITLEGGEMRVRGVKLSANASGTNTLTLAGGTLLVGKTGINHYGSTTLALNFEGGALGALTDTVMLGADAAATIATLTGTPTFASEADATLELTQEEPFLTGGAVVNQSGTLQVGDITLNEMTLEGGTLKVVGGLDVETLTAASSSKIAFDRGVLTATTCTLSDPVTLEIPLRNRLSEGGYIQMRNGGVLPDLSGTIVSLVLDANRTDAEKVLPEVPLVLGAYTDGTEPNVKGFGLTNNTNNAIADSELVLQQGDLGAGLYVSLTGTEVLKRHDAILNQTTPGTGYDLLQNTADAYPYYYFTATVSDARLLIPAGGVAVSHPTFSGEKTRIVVAGDTMVTPLKANSVAITTDIIFDLSAWASVLPDFVRGAVRDVPASFCLISGGITMAEGVTLEVDTGDFEIPAGFDVSVEATKDGLYLVIAANRPAHTVSVNFTDVTTPLVAPPAKPGVYATDVVAWNDLNSVYSSAALKVTDFGGMPSTTATSVDGTEATRLLVYTSKVNTFADAPSSMLKVWLSDTAEQTIRIQNVPFEAYRVALIFANDLEAAAYAPIQVGEGTYTMDGEGYTRRDISAYTVKHATTGLVTLEVSGDAAWGTTDTPEAAEPVVLGQNALITDVLTDGELEIVLPAAVYGRLYAGLAALQIVEASEVAAVTTAATYSYTFTTAGEYNLADLVLTTASGSTSWVNATSNSLALTSDVDVVVTLPIDFVADTVALAGAGKITLKVENNGGALLNTLDASAMTGDVTIDFACQDVAFSASAGTTTFNKAFNNNGQPYVIAEGATLVLGEQSGITTNMEPTLFSTNSAMLAIDSASKGTLRRNYPVTQNRPGQYGYAWDITLAYRDATFTNDAYWQPSLLIEEGDTLQTGGNNLWVTGNTTRRTFTYRQTGGTFTMGNTTNNNNGFLFGPAGNNAQVDGDITISGGRLHTSAILAWDASAQVAVTVSGTGCLSLWNKLHAQQNAAVTATFSDDGTLELANTALNKGGTGSVTVTFNGGRITTQQPTSTMTLPVAFTGTDVAPTTLAPEEGCTLVLNAENTGSGVIEVTRGTVAVANAAALASTSTTVKAGATFEARGFAAGTAMSNTVTFEEGATLSATAADGVTTVRIAGSLVLPADQSTIHYRLNGELYDGVTVDATAGTVTFTTKVTVTDVTWDAAQDAGVWGEGIAGPWVDGATYYNGAAVTFVNATPAKVDVTVQGDVRPGSVAWGASSADTYRFVGASDLSFLTLTSATPDMGSGQVYEIPVATSSAAALSGNSNIYRLIGELSNGRKTASLVSASNNVLNRENGDGTEALNHGVWCTEGVTLTPLAGEIQIVSAMGSTDTAKRSHLSGSGNVTITGGGTVQFGGRVIETSATDVPYQNKAFSGQIIIQDGSTLDITMVRDRNDAAYRARDDYSFFATTLGLDGNALTTQDGAGAPLWTNDTVGVRVLDGGTFRVSGCRSIFGGWANRNDTNLIASYPLEIGTEATAEFSFAALEQVFPHGFRFIGNGATLLATQNMFVTGGTTLKVAGIGDDGDRADPATDTALDTNGNPVNADTYGKLTAGITAEIASGATTGLVPWSQPNSAANPLELAVGEGSTLNITANLLALNGNAASRGRFSFKKTGTGVVRFMQTMIDAETQIQVTEGALGGSATFTAAGTAVTAAAGTTVEAGLSVPLLSLADSVTMAINPTGATVLHADRLTFTASGRYTIASLLPEAEIPEAEGLPAMKVVSWNTMRAADSAIFTLDDVLTAKGYGLELRTDGLYLMKQVTYVRELDIATAGSHRVVWYSNKAWYRLDDAAKTPRNYDPEAGEAVTALFLLPESFAAENAALPKITLVLSKEVAFANIRFAAPVEVNGETTLKTLPVTVVYEYNLTNETMPEADRAVRFTWVPTLVLMRDGNPGLASLQVSVPTGYEYTVSNTTVMVYASAAAPALNINFTEGVAGDATWVAETADPCGAVPFAGVYWNNASTTNGNLLLEEGNHSVMLLSALPAGIEPNAEGQVVPCEVTYAFNQATSVSSRMTGNDDAAIVAGFLAGNRTNALTESILTAGNFTNAGTQNGWQVRLASVPFETYDLYLILAGNSDDTVTYPSIRVKVGSADWRTFSMVNGWAAPANRTATWQGVGNLVKGEFVAGKNMLHLRVQTAAGSSLEIAPWDNGQTSDGAAAAVGLAALQVVRCDDAAKLERVGAGKWSDAGGWRWSITGGTDSGAWFDATAEKPHYAAIPMVQQLDADKIVSVPYLALTGSGSMILKGTDAAISTGTLDLSAVEPGASLTFGADVFAEPINVILAPEVTICVPESSTGTVENYWRWLNDDAGNGVDSTSATIQKKLAGDVIFFNPISANLQIDDGTLWLASNANGSAAGRVSGAGTFGKKGTGTLTHSGTFSLSGSTPIRVSEGTLALSNALTGISGGSTVLVDGGRLEMPSGGGFTTGAIVRLERGFLLCRGTMTNNLPVARLANGSTIRIDGVGGWQGYTFQSMIAEGGNNELIVASAGAGGACVDVRNEFVVMPGATLTVTRPSSGGLRVISGVVDVRDGGTLITNSRIGRGNASGYGSATDLLTKKGAGLWQIGQVLSAKGDASWGQTLDIAEGEVRFALNGANYDVANETPITVKAGARMSGNVTFIDKSPVTFEEGAIVRNGVPGVSGSRLTFHTVTFNKGTVFEMDLRNTTALTISNAATFTAGEMSVRLLNMGESFTGEKQLIAWPTTTGVPCTFTSPEAMALDAVLETRNDGLYLVASNASYVWADQTDVWSLEDGWVYQGTAISYPEMDSTTDENTPVARLVAFDSDVTVTVDKGEALADGAVWKAKSLIAAVNAGKTLTLTQGVTLTGATKLNAVMAWSDIWKLGEGAAIFSAPVQLRNAGAGASVNVADGTLTLTHPITTTLPPTGTALTDVPADVEIAADSALVYNLSASAEELTVINSAYNPLMQTLTGAVTGEGTLRVLGADNTIVLSTTADSDVNLDVQAGQLTLNGDVARGAARATRRTITVAKGAQLALDAEYVLGGSTNILWTLAADAQQGAQVTTSGGARVRGAITVTPTDTTAQNIAKLGTTYAQLDAATRIHVPAATTLEMGGEWVTPEDAALTTSLTKTGAGLLTMTDFDCNIPVTLAAGEIRLGANAVDTVNYNDRATTPIWTIASGATLSLGGGTFSLDNGALDVQSGAVLNGGVATTTIDAATTLADRTVLTFGESNSINVGSIQFKQATVVNGVITVNLDALSPADLNQTSMTLVTFDNGMRNGTGSFQLGGNKLVAWAENGWTLRDNGTEVILQHFGGDTGYYTWAGDGSAGSTGVGNWANAFWTSSADSTTLVAWPTTTDVPPSVMLQDISPVDGEAIPEEARTLDWTLPSQALESFYAKNSDAADYKITSSNGSAPFEITGDFLKAGSGKLTVERPIILGKEGALRLLGGETELTGSLTASSGEFKKPITLAGADTVLRFSGTSSRVLMGLLEGDEQATLIHSGTGTLTIGDSVDKLKALAVEAGHVRLIADGQYVVAPAVTVAAGGTLTYGGTLSGAGTVQMSMNAATAPAGTLVWSATTPSASDKAPRLGVPAGLTDAAIKVDTFRYQPDGGHLILDPNAAVLAPGFKLEMMASDEVTSALWLGAQASAGDALTVSKLSGTGIIGVEPVVELLSDATWSTHRTLTVAPTATDLAAVEAFEGSLMGATTPDGTDIHVGLTVQNPQGGARTYFRYMGTSTDLLLGTLAIGADAGAEVTGTWAGDVAVANGGLLMGNGTVGATGRTVSVPKGAILSGTTYGRRIQPNNTYTSEVIPAELTVKGTLSLETGSVLNTMIRKDASGNTWVSTVTADNLQLPTVLEDGAEEVMLTVNVDMEAGVVASGVKILGWTSLNGGQKINGTVTVTVNGEVVPGYSLRKKSDGLYLYRENARFWMILH